MRSYLVHRVTAAALFGAATAISGALVADAQSGPIDETMTAGGIGPKLELSPAQRSAIYQEVRKDKSKVAPRRFAANVGADVPPMIELYTLPDDILANNPDSEAIQVHSHRRSGGAGGPASHARGGGDRAAGQPRNSSMIDLTAVPRRGGIKRAAHFAKSAERLPRGVLGGRDHRLGQHIQIGAHEERLAGTFAVITIVGVDHGAHRASGRKASNRRSDRRVWRPRFVAVARIGDDVRARCNRLPSVPTVPSRRFSPEPRDCLRRPESSAGPVATATISVAPKAVR